MRSAAGGITDGTSTLPNCTLSAAALSAGRVIFGLPLFPRLVLCSRCTPEKLLRPRTATWHSHATSMLATISQGYSGTMGSPPAVARSEGGVVSPFVDTAACRVLFYLAILLLHSSHIHPPHRLCCFARRKTSSTRIPLMHPWRQTLALTLTSAAVLPGCDRMSPHVHVCSAPKCRALDE